MKKNYLKPSGGGFPLLLPEEAFAERMKDTVEPYLERLVRKGSRSELGNFYYELYPLDHPKGTIVVSYGFTESCLKYHELIYYFLQNGYQTAVQDHRGHGKSLREVDTKDIVHVEWFRQYTEDLHRFVEGMVRKELCADKPGLPLFLYGHSMGGCIAARYLELYPHDFAKAVLSAPMLGLKLGLCPSWAAAVVCDFNILLGRGKEKIFFQSVFKPEEPWEDSSAGSRARYDYYHAVRCRDVDYQTHCASYRWAREAIRAGRRAVRRREASRVRIPVLLFQAGNDALVKTREQDLWIKRIGDGRILRAEEARHEIYRAENRLLASFLEAIFSFLERGY